MKAQILKIAGVKNEKEFYKKFPTEEAFMAKHGKELEKAQTGKKIGLTMPKVKMVNLAEKEGFGLSKLAEQKSSNKGFDWSALNQVAPQLGTFIEGVQELNQQDKDLKNAQMYADISNLTRLAASSRPEPMQRKYVRPEDQLVQTVNPLGVGTDYLQAENGAMIGGNPTEIANFYNSPNTMYTDLGYEPLNDSNVKQYKKGAEIKKAQQGFDWSSLSGQVGGLGGALGSAAGRGTGRGGPYSKLGSTAGRVAGSFL